MFPVTTGDLFVINRSGIHSLPELNPNFSKRCLIPNQRHIIMQAKKILIVVNGENKADIVERAFFGPVTPEVPASILQLHNDVTLVGDEAALAKIGI